MNMLRDFFLLLVLVSDSAGFRFYLCSPSFLCCVSRSFVYKLGETWQRGQGCKCILGCDGNGILENILKNLLTLFRKLCKTQECNIHPEVIVGFLFSVCTFCFFESYLSMGIYHTMLSDNWKETNSTFNAGVQKDTTHMLSNLR